MTKNSQFADAQRLFARWNGGEALDVDALSTIAEGFWTGSGDLAGMVDRALQEPPIAPTIAPSIVGDLLSNIRAYWAQQAHLSTSELELYNVARERSALCFASDISADRERRLVVAIQAVSAQGLLDDLQRPLSTRILAELAYRLVFEFDCTEYAQIGSAAFRFLAVKWPGAKGLRDLCRSFELRLSDLGSVRQNSNSTAPGEFDRLWAELQADAEKLMQHWVHNAVEPLIEPWTVLTMQALLAVLVQDENAVRQCTEKLIDAFDTIYNAEPERRRDGRYGDELSQLASGVLNLLRARMSLGIAVREEERNALCRLLRTLRLYRYAGAEEQRIFDAHWGADGITDLEAYGRARATIKIHVDEQFLRRHVDELLATPAGNRWGLALSGGGFRAAFFHLGVLAWFAESGYLRQIDAISCVSGGSIVGACYALRMKTLLLSKYDLDVEAGDYVEVVRDVMDRFITAVQRNIRMRAIASPITVLRLWLQSDYTFAERIAEMLDLELFRALSPRAEGRSTAELKRMRLTGDEMTRPGARGQLEANPMSSKKRLGWPVAPWDLQYAPKGESPGFSPTQGDNLMRYAKMPEIAFNATAINTGNAFRFSAHAHGELADRNIRNISRRPVLSWMPYDCMTAGAHLNPERLPLSRVVAASASVPGIIPPILLERSGQEVALAVADGGVFDNQGIDHLMESRCTHIIVSDASGQLQYEANPDVTNIAVIARSTDMLMERVRGLNYARLDRAIRTHHLRRLTYLHLTADLKTPPPSGMFEVDDTWAHKTWEHVESQPTSYGVTKGLQGLLAALRTDLDCFSETEMYGLMLSGYLQAKNTGPPPTGPASTAADPPWAFLKISRAMGSGIDSASPVVVNLTVGNWRFFRLPRIVAIRFMRFHWTKRLLFGAMALGIALASGWALAPHLASLARSLIESRVLNGSLLALVAFSVFALKCPPSAWKRRIVKFASGPLLLAAMLWAWVALLLADPIFRRLGRVR